MKSRNDRKKVETLFAHLKRILKLDRLRLRGLKGAPDQSLMAAQFKTSGEWRSGSLGDRKSEVQYLCEVATPRFAAPIERTHDVRREARRPRRRPASLSQSRFFNRIGRKRTPADS
jgi:hypothetical protein